jgi:Raf kinase inhibitor-like YbhB/YbcL family protein
VRVIMTAREWSWSDSGVRISFLRRETAHGVHDHQQQFQGRRLSAEGFHPVGGFRLRLRRGQHVAASRVVRRAAATKSFAVTCYDPDAPTGSDFWHWLVVNIPANVTALAEGAGSAGGKLPAGALQTRTDFGALGYGGPCPPAGDHPHRYLFTVFAVKADKLDVKADTSAAVVGFNLHFNTLAKASMMGLFKR